MPSLLAQLQPPANHFGGGGHRGGHPVDVFTPIKPEKVYPDQQYPGPFVPPMTGGMTGQHHRGFGGGFGGRPSFVELRSVIRQRRAQYQSALPPLDELACGYCQTQLHITNDNEAYSRCCACGLPVHSACVLHFRSGARRLNNSQLLCYPWLCTECKTCWICGSGVNMVSIRNNCDGNWFNGLPFKFLVPHSPYATLSVYGFIFSFTIVSLNR